MRVVVVYLIMIHHILSYCYYFNLALLHSDSHFIFSFTAIALV